MDPDPEKKSSVPTILAEPTVITDITPLPPPVTPHPLSMNLQDPGFTQQLLSQLLRSNKWYLAYGARDPIECKTTDQIIDDLLHQPKKWHGLHYIHTILEIVLLVQLMRSECRCPICDTDHHFIIIQQVGVKDPRKGRGTQLFLQFLCSAALVNMGLLLQSCNTAAARLAEKLHMVPRQHSKDYYGCGLKLTRH